MNLETTVDGIARRAVAALGLEVVDVRQDGRRHVRVWIDREPQGVMIQDCADANHGIKRALAEEGIDPGAFHVEVLSPGLDRPLTREKDYARFQGALVVVHLAKKRGDRRKFRGRLKGLQDGRVVIDEEDTKAEMRFERHEIDETRLVPEIK
ncbi:ribosome maturation factor RimP [bacterium]|nr:ribosome maturation factor RimP [bacterium]